MPVASNTSPIFNLAMIGQLHLLREQFEEVLAPEAVDSELEPVSHLPELAAYHDALRDQWLRVVPIENHQLVRTLRLSLDHGEAEAITLALERGLRRVLIDERDARNVAKQLGLETPGVLGILLRAKRDQRLDAVRPAMLALKEKAGFYIGEALFRRVLQEAGEESE